MPLNIKIAPKFKLFKNKLYISFKVSNEKHHENVLKFKTVKRSKSNKIFDFKCLYRQKFNFYNSN